MKSAILGGAAIAAALKLRAARGDESDEALNRTMTKYRTTDVWEIQREIETEEAKVSAAQEQLDLLRKEKADVKHQGNGETDDLLANISRKVEEQEEIIQHTEETISTLKGQKKAIMKQCGSPGRKSGHKHLYVLEKSWDEDYWHYEISRCIYCGKKKTLSEDYLDYVPSDPCFIATAAYGTPLHPRIASLRAYRDRYLPVSLTRFYYGHSPQIADWVRRHDRARILVRAFLAPVTELTGRLTG